MDISAIALASMIAWLSLLTGIVLLLVRQLGLVTLRLDARAPIASNDTREGPDIGTSLPQTVLDTIPGLRAGLNYLLLVSPTCMPCHELVPQLNTLAIDANITALVPGSPRLADAFVRLFPQGYDIVRDPVASEVADEIALRQTPFAVEIEDGIITGKAHLFTVADLQRLVEARRTSNAADIANLVREGDRHVVASTR